jgi:hypothetical protein
LLAWIERAPDVRELGARGDLREALEHAAGADRGQLRRVADQDELRARALDQLA